MFSSRFYLPLSILSEYATCSVRGKYSDHIKTFNGLNYRTKGYCLHELVKDCGHREFSIKVKYERSPSGSQVAKRTQGQGQGGSKVTTAYHLHLVSIRFGSTSAKVYRNGRLRVNKPRKLRAGRKSRKSARSRKRAAQKSAVVQEPEEGKDTTFLQQMSTSIGGGKVSIRLESLGVILSWDVVKGNLKVKVKAQRYLGQRRLCGLCGSVDNNPREKSAVGARITRNKRFEPVMPSHMAWVWRRGHTCRKRNRAAREELRQKTNSNTSSLHTEIESLLNSVKTSSDRVSYTTQQNSRQQFYREDEIVIKPLDSTGA
ncbi:hypothetical protein ElyMa_004706600 [Elysia marginata]|uniref:VWFD domain-containing protein n=1 Tax=Elysia marginata TaxID=1093978 RepID=A0AAV4IAB9_9GAST|nr:hypothetical protein ElyMa_004706600 [Elysia marginata]